MSILKIKMSMETQHRSKLPRLVEAGTPGANIESLPPHLLRRILLMAGPSSMSAAVFSRRCSPRMLIVGDGDFTFANAIAHIRNRRKGMLGVLNSNREEEEQEPMPKAEWRAHVLCATSYDSRAELENKYGASNITRTLHQLSCHDNVRIIHRVDATNMDVGTLNGNYDLIVFNFPKVDATTLEEFRIAGRVPRNRYLIAGFLASAARLLRKKTGTILIAQKIGHPYRCWSCEDAIKWMKQVNLLRHHRGADSIAAANSLAYEFKVPFVKGIFPGYRCANVSPEEGGRRRKKGFSVQGADGSPTAQVHVFSLLKSNLCECHQSISPSAGPLNLASDDVPCCSICDAAFSSQIDFKSHLSGKRHRLNKRNTEEWDRYLEYLKSQPLPSQKAEDAKV